MPEKISVFVGFGGSGGKILREYASLVASDHRWSNRAAKDLYFLLCDTDVNDIKQSAKTIEATFASHAKPYVETIHLAENAVSVEDGISQKFLRDSESGAYTKEDQDRFLQAWWSKKDPDSGETLLDDKGNPIPFKVRQLVFSVQQGAGQCPMVSYFLAWAKADKVRREVSNLVDAIDNRRATGGRKPQVELTLAASLAGGTGRGCWYILSFMLRRELISRGYTPKPAMGYFLDQGVFSDVQGGMPEQSVKMKVNSLTGLSELIMWIRIENQDKEQAPEYFLPSMDNPKNPECDAIRSHKTNKSHDLTAHAPLSNAQLVFSHSKTSRLNRPDEYYEMVGAALYARTADPSIDAKQINSMPRIGALGSTRVEVPHRKIDMYLKREVICNLLRESVGLSGRKPSLPPALQSKNRKEWIFKKLRDKVSTGCEELAETFVNNAELSDSGLVVETAIEAIENQLEIDKDKRLVSQDWSDLIKMMYRPVPQGGFLSGEMSNYQSALKSFLMEQISTESQDFRMNDAAAAARALNDELLDLDRALDEIIAKPKDLRAQVTAKMNELKGRGEKTSLLRWFSRRPYTESEIEEIKNEMIPAIRETRVAAVAAQLKAILAPLKQDLSQLSGAIDTAVNQVLEGLVVDFEHEKQEHEKSTFILPRNSEDQTVDGVQDWNIEGKFRAPHDPARFVHRTLYPVLNQSVQDCCEDVLRSPHVARNRKALVDLVHEYIHDEDAHSNDGRSRLRRHLKMQIDQLMGSIDIPDDIIRKYFNFTAVVKGQLEMWNELFRAHPSQSQDLLNIFCEHFGCQVEDVHIDSAEKTPRTPDLQVILDSLALSAARDCDPFVVIEAGADTRDELGDFAQVVLPDSDGYGEESRRNLKSRYREAGLRLQEWVLGGRDDSAEAEFQRRNTVTPDSVDGNPYILVGYTMKSILDQSASVEDTSSFRRVKSLQYFREPGSQLLQLLSDTESEKGLSVFTNVDGNLGLGYSDPRFVTNEEYRELRWRPWIDQEAERAAERQRGRTAAILYALRGARSDRESDELKAHMARISEMLQTRNTDESLAINTPIVRWDSEGNEFTFQRNPIGAHPGLVVDVKGNPKKKKLTFTKFFEYVDQLDKTDALFSLITSERDRYENELCQAFGIAPVDRKVVDQCLLMFLEDLQLEMESHPVTNAEQIQDIVQELIDHHRRDMGST